MMKLLVYISEIYKIIQDGDDYYMFATIGGIAVYDILIKLTHDEIDLFKKDHVLFFNNYKYKKNNALIEIRAIPIGEKEYSRLKSFSNHWHRHHMGIDEYYAEGIAKITFPYQNSCKKLH